MNTQQLITWAEQYFKSRDAFYKSIQSIEKDEKGLTLHHKEKVERILVAPVLSSLSPEESKQAQSLVTLSNDANLDTLAKDWEQWKQVNVKIHFLNSQTQKRWVLNPHAHSRVCDEKSLRKGLQSLAEEA